MMAAQDSNNAQTHSLALEESTTELGVNRPTQTRIKIRIPKDLHEEPVISRLISHHGVTVNIAAALLSANSRDDGWFDLELRGRASQVQSALTYLNELDLEIWGQSNSEEDGW
ncbi:NIL domain-containing protein [Chroococcidiopsis sp. CCMEE 29]|uniref:NIL domain-containing protein n=1 Tax=Chroococcidiopsis sp. CCMEE 29 TaxID=155894 RepID=UPI00201FF873|nr:NIL domain-containing protein [Chroococcidiopsis sp. CCMEE 29]